MPKHHITMQFMKTFSCIGSDCELNCCNGWTVSVTAPEIDTIDTLLQQVPTLGRTKEEVFGQTQKGHHLKLKNDGSCTFQCGKGLCDLQAKAGPKALPYVCATYPRQIHQHGDRFELSGLTSCPEVARNLFFTPHATRRVPADKSHFPRYLPNSATVAPEEKPWTHYLDDIRNLALEILQLPYPIAHRLFLLTELTRRLNTVLTPKTTQVAEAVIKEALGPMLDVKNLTATHEHLTTLGWTAEHVFSVPLNLIAIRTIASQSSRSEHTRELFSAICSADNLDLEEIEVTATKLWPSHQQRSKKLHAQHDSRLDMFHTRYAEHYWFHEHYTSHPSLNAHMARLLLLLAAQRILVVNHPDIASKLDAGVPVPLDLLDRVQVETVANLSRNMEHNRTLNELLSAVSSEDSYAHTQRLCFV